MLTDSEYAEHQRRAAEFSTLILGQKELCGCEACEEARAYYEAMARVYLARS